MLTCPRCGIHSKPLMVPAHEYNRTLSILKEAVSYLREGKAQFAPNTTNSHVDVFLARYDAKESNAKTSGPTADTASTPDVGCSAASDCSTAAENNQ